MSSQADPRSPLAVLVPYDAHPAEQLAQRFTEWRKVLKAIIVYLSEVASVQEEIIRQNAKVSNILASHGISNAGIGSSGSGLSGSFNLTSAANKLASGGAHDKHGKNNNGWFFSGSEEDNTHSANTINHFFLPIGNGSIQDVPIILRQYHDVMAAEAAKGTRELQNSIIPGLESLNKDLVLKIKSIKSLSSDFKNNCSKELDTTRECMVKFQQSINQARKNVPARDPYLLKVNLDNQIRRQLSEENFLHEAFMNLQSSGQELEKIVVASIQNAFRVLAQILGAEAKIIDDQLVNRLLSSFLSLSPSHEWDNFLLRDNTNFIPLNLPMRKFKEIEYTEKNDPLTLVVQCGYLERRSKYLKSYTKGYYVLTPNYLHEFKTSDRKRDSVPLFSLSLAECKVVQHTPLNECDKKGEGKDSQSYKFILHTKTNGLIHRGHNWVFRTTSSKEMLYWFKNLSELTTFNNQEEKVKYLSTLKAKIERESETLAPMLSARSSTTRSRAIHSMDSTRRSCSDQSAAETNGNTTLTKTLSIGNK